MNQKGTNMAYKQSIDHLGNTFPSETAMCEYWNVNYKTYRLRIKNNWSIEKALTGSNDNHTITDHLGQTFNTQKEMCTHWKISYRTYRRRLIMGWDTKHALETPSKIKTEMILDHTGQGFKTAKDMCEHWGIDPHTYLNRMKYGWSREKALTTPMKNRQITDPYGNVFPSQHVMAKAYGKIPSSVQTSYMRTNHSLVEALGIITPICWQTKNYQYDAHLLICEMIKDESDYFMCKLDGNDIIMHRNTIIKYCEQHLPPDKNPQKSNRK